MLAMLFKYRNNLRNNNKCESVFVCVLVLCPKGATGRRGCLHRDTC